MRNFLAALWLGLLVTGAAAQSNSGPPPPPDIVDTPGSLLVFFPNVSAVTTGSNGNSFGWGTISAAGIQGGSNGSLSINLGGTGGVKLTGASIAIGTVPVGTTGSCVASSFVGGSTAGKFSAAVCAGGTFILSSLPTVTNGYTCDAQDQTTSADTLKQIASTTSSVTFTATTVAADVVVFKCVAW